MKKQLSFFTVALGLIALPTANHAFPRQDTATQDKKDDKMDHGKMADDSMSHSTMSKKKHKKSDKWITARCLIPQAPVDKQQTGSRLQGPLPGLAREVKHPEPDRSSHIS